MNPLEFKDNRALRILELNKQSQGQHKCLSCRYAPINIDNTLHSVCSNAKELTTKYWDLYSKPSEGLLAERLEDKEGLTIYIDVELARREMKPGPKMVREGNHVIVFKSERVDENASWIKVCECYEPIEDSDKYYIYIQSDEWKEKRLQALDRAGYRCQVCGDGMNLQVHHVTYDRLGNEHEDDLIAVCKRCHEKIHSGKFTLTKRR